MILLFLNKAVPVGQFFLGASALLSYEADEVWQGRLVAHCQKLLEYYKALNILCWACFLNRQK